MNLFTKKAHQFKKGVKTGEYEETEIPEESKELFDRYYAELIESISATDDTLLEHYLEGAEISRDEAIAAMKEAMKRMELFPLFCRLQRIELRNAGDPLDDRRADAERVRDGRAARVQGRRGRRDGRDPRDRRPCRRRARVQDDVRAARRRRHVLPAFLRRDQQRRRVVQRHPERRREAQPSVDRRRERTASRSRRSTPATSAASPSCATRTPTTRCRRVSIRCGCR